MVDQYNVRRTFSADGEAYFPGHVLSDAVAASLPNLDALMRAGYLVRGPRPAPRKVPPPVPAPRPEEFRKRDYLAELAEVCRPLIGRMPWANVRDVVIAQHNGLHQQALQQWALLPKIVDGRRTGAGTPEAARSVQGFWAHVWSLATGEDATPPAVQGRGVSNDPAARAALEERQRNFR
jgi:hypothetical protein